MITAPTVVRLTPDSDAGLTPTCPLCHTLDHTLTNDSLAAGGEWQCTRCGQTWNATRLATAAAHDKRYAREGVHNETDVGA
jgi:predicted Zn finger-like uncharacterized protein